MLSRAVPAVLFLVLAAGCATGATETGAAPAPASPAPSEVVDLPVPSIENSEPPSPLPDAGGRTISGTVTAGVEPNCLIVQDNGTHLLVFDDPAMRADAPVGRKVTLTGKSDPTMMSTCQQGVPFIVSAIKAG